MVASDHIPVGIRRTVTVCVQPPARIVDAIQSRLEEVSKMATQLCEKCKQAHPGRVCDFDEKGECAETTGDHEITPARDEASKDEADRGRVPVRSN